MAEHFLTLYFIGSGQRELKIQNVRSKFKSPQRKNNNNSNPIHPKAHHASCVTKFEERHDMDTWIDR